MLHVPAHLTRQEAFDRALSVGVRVYDTTVCYFEPEKAPKMLTIGFTALPIEKVKDAAHRLAKAWR
jgi:DNA-binding transcriptional MocR family regulator